jgi:hypothetical protein
MRYDRVRIRFNQDPRTVWRERSQAEENNVGEEFDAFCDALYTQGTYVVLVAGKNYCFDELFLFADVAEAWEFYDHGFQAWESFPEGDNEGYGFQEVSLYERGRRIATKSCEPTTRTVDDHGTESVAEFERAAEFMEGEQMVEEGDVQ